MQKSIGLLIIGINGCTANTLITGISAMANGYQVDNGGVTYTDQFDSLDLIDMDRMIISGWDLDIKKKPHELAKEYQILPDNIIKIARPLLKKIKSKLGITTKHDLYEGEFNFSLEQSINHVEKEIEKFKKSNSLTDVIVLNLGSPLDYDYCLKEENQIFDSKNIEDFLAMSLEEMNGYISRDYENAITSNMIYAIAAINKGCSFIDFTANLTLEIKAIQDLAKSKNVCIAGTDGSTGETMIKMVIAEMFKIRNLKVDGWYSCNILGNNDGSVLSLPEYSAIKLKDKKNNIPPILGYSDFEHKVRIDYYKTKGDNKESFDVINFSGWCNMPMEMKINWEGRDSILAAPMLIDLIRLVEFEMRNENFGIQDQFAVFFKHPIGEHSKSFFDQYRELKSHYEKYQ